MLDMVPLDKGTDIPSLIDHTLNGALPLCHALVSCMTRRMQTCLSKDLLEESSSASITASLDAVRRQGRCLKMDWVDASRT
jgi:hypothetical protein